MLSDRDVKRPFGQPLVVPGKQTTVTTSQSRTSATESTVDLASLSRYLRGRLDRFAGTIQTATLIGGGRSNPTYAISDGQSTWVLRRPPYGHVLPSAHDMKREFRVINALKSTAVPVPSALLLCEDAGVIGAPFYVMELVEGISIRTVADAEALPPATRGRLGFALADVLSTLHSVDPASVGLDGFGRPDGYLERQLRRWSDQWKSSATVERPEVLVLLDKLRRALPVSAYPGIVHGDVKIDNVLLFPDDPGRIAAVIDWEMATCGDTLADVGIMLSFWDEPGIVDNPLTSGLTRLSGFPDRSRMLDCYSSRRGITLADIDWYVVFADFKVAVILEGIHARHSRGATVGEGFDGVGDMVGPLLGRALHLASTSSNIQLRR